MELSKIEKLSSFSVKEECKSEEDVKIKFILPLLEAFGHDRYNMEVRGMDIVVKNPNSRCSLIIEAKHHSKNLSYFVNQLKKYWDEQRSTIAILSNGIELWIYHPSWPERKFEDSIIMKIKKEDLINKVNILKEILSNEALVSGKVLEYLRKYEKSFEEKENEITNLEKHKTELTDNIKKLQSEVDVIDHRLSELRFENKEEIKITKGYNIKKGGDDDIHCQALSPVNYYGLTLSKQIMYCTSLAQSFKHVFLFCTGKPDNNYKLSPEGIQFSRDLPTFNKSNYIAEYECIQLKDNNIKMWEKLYHEKLFPFWDPQSGPFRFHDNKPKRIAICKVYNINEAVTKDDVIGDQINRGLKPEKVLLIKENLNNKIALLDDKFFLELREKIINIISPYI